MGRCALAYGWAAFRAGWLAEVRDPTTRKQGWAPSQAVVEALQLLGVDAHHKTGAKALKAQRLQLMPTGHARPTTVGRHQLLCALDARPARAFAARRAIDKQLATVRACLRDGEALPDAASSRQVVPGCG